MPKKDTKFKKGNPGMKKGTKHKKTLEREHILEEVKKSLEQKIMGHIPELIDVKVEAAKGLYEYRKGPDGLVRVYKTKPDGKAGEYLVDRVMGKPKERLETEDLNPLKVLLIDISKTPEPLVSPENRRYVETKKIEPNRENPTGDKRPVLTREAFEQSLEDRKSVLD